MCTLTVIISILLIYFIVCSLELEHTKMHLENNSKTENDMHWRPAISYMCGRCMQDVESYIETNDDPVA